MDNIARELSNLKRHTPEDIAASIASYDPAAAKRYLELLQSPAYTGMGGKRRRKPNVRRVIA